MEIIELCLVKLENECRLAITMFTIINNKISAIDPM